MFLTPFLFGCSRSNSEPTPSKDPTPTPTPTASTPTPSNEEPIPVDVVIISGQSNAVGCTHSDEIMNSMGIADYARYQNGYTEIQIAYDCWTKVENPGQKAAFVSQNKSKNDDFVKVALGQGNGSGTFGPEIGIAEAMHEKYANKLFLIKYACGASNLKDDWTTRDSPMYGRFINYVKKQMNNLVYKGYAPAIKAFCWMQGEGDAYYTHYRSYQDNLRFFVTNVREDLKDLADNKVIPFIDAGISSASVWEYYKEINEAKAAFAEESVNNIYIDTIAAGMHTDQEPLFNVDECHYDSESEILLGHLFAEKIELFL